MVTISLLLCLQMFNVCVYVPAWMFPTVYHIDITESVLELAVEAIANDRSIMFNDETGDTNPSQAYGLQILEDLHPPEEEQLEFLLFAHAPIENNYYHFTPDIKTYVFSVVSPPPDFC